MRPNTLQPFSSVKSSTDVQSALKDAKIRIREDVARAVMKNMLEVELVKNISSEDVKKRFLWMVGARTAQLAADYAVQSDLWLSGEGIYYVLVNVNADTVNQIYDPIFQEEMNTLQAYGDTRYLARPVLKWE
jgi:hypothetical protein